VPAAIHISPEAAVGGPLAKVRDGDVIRVDAVAGTLQVHVPSDEWESRENATTDLTPSHFGMGRELFAVFRNAAAPAHLGGGIFNPAP